MLPAEAAHSKMWPPERERLMKGLDWNNLNARRAAVLLLVYPRNEQATFVLIVRNAYEGVHSSQVALPGGKKEPFDRTFGDTALRETFEEIGVDRSQMVVIRELSQVYIPPSNFIVHPFLGYCESELVFTPDPREVAGIIEVGLDDFLDDAAVVALQRNTSYANEIHVPGFQIGEHMVWGATAMILSEFKEVVKMLA